jgi:hypothetical protein
VDPDLCEMLVSLTAITILRRTAYRRLGRRRRLGILCSLLFLFAERLVFLESSALSSANRVAAFGRLHSLSCHPKYPTLSCTLIVAQAHFS